MVTVTITDINDNPPLLSHQVYNLTLSESTETGTLHNLYITYTDADTGNNAAVEYEIEGTSKYLHLFICTVHCTSKFCQSKLYFL